MTITSVRFSGTPDKDFLAYVSVVFDDVFVVKNIKIVKSRSDPSALRVFMPSRMTDDGGYSDLAHPIAQSFRTYLEDSVLNAWRQRDGSPERAAA